MPEKGIRWETGAAPATVSVDERANHCTGCFFLAAVWEGLH
ncbi:hypothetical protein BF29_2686 [Heyndrickxia coagulans DSM 1 = ATCC 7050]|uniref:Uncharacterized protein n=2 Tax=Heyndrickxia coagulans TaxID=1398 RepID=A0A150JY79_HEYCO|nr:hypothetical protein BCO26_0218 [Heyndrickxia coagulans 2-6]AJH78333.1 hypothetical protein BF29_2686 [Heyndrickxia coagulans DSM 1 = ATCC 7050]KYC60632.1 hypothetical protein B4100_1122 [Heyndrickxia coagulans]KYC62249.1 hypothetical protein B4098_1031 [Heyndrickxia coagulans]SHE84109.1 hypothetical protein SAMN02745208_00971 [Heyndrickxia coagulans DSM 1 = ATCC 7050]